MWQGTIYQPGDRFGTVSAQGEAHIWIVGRNGKPLQDDLLQGSSEDPGPRGIIPNSEAASRAGRDG